MKDTCCACIDLRPRNLRITSSPPDRYYIALSLEEAEHLRSVMHQLQGTGGLLGTNASIALRAGREMQQLDAADNFRPASRYQNVISDQCFRFLDSEVPWQAYVPRLHCGWWGRATLKLHLTSIRIILILPPLSCCRALVSSHL